MDNYCFHNYNSCSKIALKLAYSKVECRLEIFRGDPLTGKDAPWRERKHEGRKEGKGRDGMKKRDEGKKKGKGWFGNPPMFKFRSKPLYVTVCKFLINFYHH